jgi:putative ABC transport system permease protein
MIEGILRDVRFAARGLRRTPGFTAAAVLTLALGIGATTAVFSVVYGVIFRPLPFPTADRLVQVVQLIPQRSGGAPSRVGLTADQVTEWRATSRTLAEIGYSSPSSMALTGVATPVRLNGAAVTVSLFRALGVEPLRGRIFTNDDELAGNQRVVILSRETWAARFGSVDGVLESSIALNERSYRVIGVMPDGFRFPSFASPAMSLNSAGELSDAPEFWIPIVAGPRPAGPAQGGFTAFTTLALLRPDVTVQQATADANTLMPARMNRRFSIELVNARVEHARAVRPILLLFQAAVLFVLLIAAVNVVNQLLARAASRRQELVVRLALGATRMQLARYAVAEGTLIGAGGGGLGCLLAYQIVALFRTLPPFLLPRMSDVHVDALVLASACAVSIGAGLLVGLVTAIRTVRGDLAQGSIPWQSRTASRSQRPSRALVIAETAAGVVLLAGAGLLLTSFTKLTSVDRGFQPEGVFTFNVSLPARYQAAASRYAFHDELTAALRQIPGTTSIGASDYMIGQGASGCCVTIDGQQSDTWVGFQVIAPGMFETLRIPLRGRDFTERDRGARAAVVIVNEMFVRRFFNGWNPVGRQIQFQKMPALEIIGVAGDTRMRELDAEVAPAFYLPQALESASFRAPTYVLRSSRRDSLLATIRAAAARIDGNAVVFDATPMDALLTRSVATPKLYSATAVGFAIVAVALAALGLYGVLSYSVGIRTREFGIRIALGATPGTVVKRVIRESLGTVLLGVAVGIAGALHLSRFLEALLFGVQPRDPVTLSAVAILFLAVAALASYIPARRATRVDPVVALRAE